MKVSSALTMTTVLSILSAAHGAPISSVKEAPSNAPTHGHYRRASSVSELTGRQYIGSDHLEGLNFAHEPGNSIKTLLSFVKRQLGSTDSTSAASSTTGGTGSSSTSPDLAEQTGQTETANNGGHGLMGGGMSSVSDAGFAFEPGQDLRTA